MKEVKWNSRAREFVRSLDEETRQEIGALLMRIQSGVIIKEPRSKPMKSIHKNAHELRLMDREGSYRIIYVLNIGNKVFVPHAFTKKTQKTPIKETELSILRLQELLNENQ